MAKKLLLFVWSLFVMSAYAHAQEILKGDINLMVVSDLGRNGYYDQKPIASLMGRIAEQTPPDAILALGDIHHYLGIESVDDPLWLTNFELIYDHPELQVEWNPVLGNHEYKGNAQAVVDYSSKSRRWEMPNRYYSKSFKKNDVTIKVIFLDTPSLIDEYIFSNIYPDAKLENMESQLQWLDDELSNSNEMWVIVVGHHPIYAYTDKDDTERTDMQHRVDKILRKHKVDMYVSGHIHNFQHIKMPNTDIDYIVNSSASLSRPVQEIDGTLYCNGESGFSYICVSKNQLDFNMIDKKGDIVYTISRFINQ